MRRKKQSTKTEELHTDDLFSRRSRGKQHPGCSRHFGFARNGQAATPKSMIIRSTFRTSYDLRSDNSRGNDEHTRHIKKRVSDMAALACHHLQARLFRCGDILEECFGLHRPHVWKEGFQSLIPSATTGLTGLHWIHTDYILSIIDRMRLFSFQDK